MCGGEEAISVRTTRWQEKGLCRGASGHIMRGSWRPKGRAKRTLAIIEVRLVILSLQLTEILLGRSAGRRGSAVAATPTSSQKGTLSTTTAARGRTNRQVPAISPEGRSS